ncbi:MAG: hypothetical protein LQ349_005698 [Xanthoria aureola]|nr:MAG: hypothetical protein LQ349_005698 [Xanthoria aureola]
MATPPTLHLRCALQTLKLQPSRFPTTHIHSRQQSSTRFLPTSRPSPQHHIILAPKNPLRSIRFASDTSTHPASTHPSASSPAASNPASIPAASSISPPSHSSTTTSTSSPPSPDPLTWNTYLTLRRLRRRYSLIASLLSTSTTTSLGFITIASNFDYLASLITGAFGVDPILLMAAGMVGVGGTGWLLGPFVGEGVFRAVYRREWGLMSVKEKDFYARIRKYRVDPSLASYSNPLPDYYGEKIGSVTDFRTWMRDQRAYNRKRMAV